MLIDSISFFAAPDNGGPNWNGTSTWQMTISTSVNPVGALDPTFANNVGGDVALFDTKTFTGTQNVNDLITFDGAGSFSYDPGNGDLLIDIIRTAGPAFGVGLDRGIDPGLLDRAYAFNSTTTADGWNQDFGNRTRFGLRSRARHRAARRARPRGARPATQAVGWANVFVCPPSTTLASSVLDQRRRAC